jgi:hypothetical protein
MEAHMNGLHAWKFGLATALTFSILYMVCALAVTVFPDGTVDFFNNWFHGLDLRLLKPPAGRPLTLVQFVYGLASAAVVSFAAGAVLAGLYNVFLGRTARR